MRTLAEEIPCNLVADVVKGCYFGYHVKLIKKVDLGDLGVWYFTQDVPNEYTQEWCMWFKYDHLNIQGE